MLFDAAYDAHAADMPPPHFTLRLLSLPDERRLTLRHFFIRCRFVYVAYYVESCRYARRQIRLLLLTPYVILLLIAALRCCLRRATYATDISRRCCRACR